LEVEVTRGEKDSALQRIVRLIREAQDSKAPAQRAIDKWGDAYAIFALSAAALFYVFLKFASPAGGETSAEDAPLYRAMTLLVVLSPCALVLSVPSAVLAAIAAGARQGILFRGGAAVERLADVDCVCFDKTGTLTAGVPEVAALEIFPADADRDRALSALLTLEAATTHPFAAGVVRACQQAGARLLPVQGLSNSPGQGVSGTVAGSRWSVGTREFVGGSSLPAAAVPTGAIVSEVWASDGAVTVRATLVDRIREASRPTLEALHAAKIRTVMLDGRPRRGGGRGRAAGRHPGLCGGAYAGRQDGRDPAILRGRPRGRDGRRRRRRRPEPRRGGTSPSAWADAGATPPWSRATSSSWRTASKDWSTPSSSAAAPAAPSASTSSVSVGAALGMAAYVIFRGAPCPSPSA
jgi:hypothetical protein